MSNQISPANRILLEQLIDSLLEAEGNDLYNTFIQPFVDVGVTAAYGLEKLSAQVQTIVKGFFLGLPTLFVPFLEYDYETFREEENDKVEAIKKKYEKTLQANLDAITSNDAFGLAFLLAPSTVLAGQLAVKAPAVALKVLDVLTGGAGLLKGLQQALSGAKVGIHDPGGHDAGAWAGGGAGGTDITDSGMYEAANKNSTKQIQNALKDKKVQTAIQNSPVAKQMRQDGVAILVNHVQNFLALNDYAKMREKAKNDAGFAQIGQQLSQLNQSGQVPKENNPIVAQAMVPQLKKIYKDFWVQKLQELMKKYPEASLELQNGMKQIQSIP